MTKIAEDLQYVTFGEVTTEGDMLFQKVSPFKVTKTRRSLIFFHQRWHF